MLLLRSPTQSRLQPDPRGARGFTLMEVMIVVAIVGILAAVAYPSFMEQVRKGRRADAVAALNQIAQAQERWRANNPTYSDNLSTAGLNVPNPSSGYYTLSVSAGAASAVAYSASASAVGAQAKDLRCQRLTLAASAGQFSYTSTGSASANVCWSR